jgi:hypothetical protein
MAALARVSGVAASPVLRTLYQSGIQCWLGLFEQIFGIAKWNACRVQATAMCSGRLK